MTDGSMKGEELTGTTVDPTFRNAVVCQAHAAIIKSRTGDPATPKRIMVRNSESSQTAEPQGGNRLSTYDNVDVEDSMTSDGSAMSPQFPQTELAKSKRKGSTRSGFDLVVNGGHYTFCKLYLLTNGANCTYYFISLNL